MFRPFVGKFAKRAINGSFDAVFDASLIGLGRLAGRGMIRLSGCHEISLKRSGSASPRMGRAAAETPAGETEAGKVGI